MASLFAVRSYDSMVTHWALADREDIAKSLPADAVTADNWWHWKTTCGAKIVAHPDDRLPVNCQRCIAGLAKARRTVAELRSRFGDGI